MGIYSWYGRFLNVNWPWVLELIVYHSIFSITVPILLIESIFYNVKSEPWVSRRTLILLSLILAVDVMLINNITPYKPSFSQYIFAILLITLSIVVSLKSPPSVKRRFEVPSAKRLWLYTTSWSIAFIILYWVVPHLQPYPQIVVILGILHFFTLLKLFNRYEWDATSPVKTYALASGPVTLLISLTPIHELSKSTRPDNPQGMLIVGLAALALLLLGYIRVKSFVRE